MLFGESTQARDAAALLEQAAEAGVSFFDCAEMYPVPQRAETQGQSEAILGQWLGGKRRQALLHVPLSPSLQAAPVTACLADLSEAFMYPYCVASMECLCREDLVIATKVTGPSGQMPWIRGGPHALDAAAIRAAITGSLQRLGTDYIDLYQLHWPDRCALPCRLSPCLNRPRSAASLVLCRARRAASVSSFNLKMWM